jgi:hypothetical protein
VLILYCYVSVSPLSGYDVGKWDLRVTNDWTVVDPEENCLLVLREAVEAADDEWCRKLNKLFDEMLAAAASKNEKQYRECFVDSEKRRDSKTVREQMSLLRKANESWVLKKCLWGRRNDGRLFVLVVASTDERATMYANDTPHLRKILYAVKKNGKLKFTTALKERELEKIVKRELYPSLQVDVNRPAEEIRLERRFKKNRRKLEAKLERQEDFNCYFYDTRLAAFKSYGYRKKDMWKLYNELEGILPDNIKEIEDNDILFAKYALSTGRIRIFKHPILITGFLREKIPRLKKTETLLDELYLLLFHKAHQERKYPNTSYTRRLVDRFILWAYCVKTFRGIEYLDLWGAIYSPEKDYIYFEPFPDLAKYYRKPGDINWKQIPDVYKEDEEGNILHFEDEKDVIRGLLPIYMESNLEHFLAPASMKNEILNRLKPAKLSDFSKIVENSEYREYFNIPPDSECMIYKPGMDFLKVPTIDPKSYKFPDLEKALKKIEDEKDE